MRRNPLHNKKFKIFLNHDRLIDNVIDLAQKCYNLEDIGLAQVDKSENNKSSNIPNKYNEELNVFYKELVKDQLGVETIVINYIPKDFETRKWARYKYWVLWSKAK